MIRIIAVLFLFIPGIISAFGIKLMRDSLFDEIYAFFFYPGVQFVAGLILFISGIAFIGGFVVYRDRKKQRIKKESKSKN